MNTKPAEKFFETVRASTVDRYIDYWNDIKPTRPDDVLRRFLFAFTSVHTSWQGNVRGYNALKDLGWMKDKDDLLNRLKKARCGMYNVRTKAIWEFASKFYANVDYYCEEPSDWTSYRNELVEDINGLGIAKVSFALEMCFPNEARLSCIDTHGIQLYELENRDFKSKKGLETYETVEKHWVDNSDDVDSPSYIARCIFWDKKQNRRNTRYWSYVLE